MQKITKELDTFLIEGIETKIKENPFGFSEESIIDLMSSEIERQRKYRIVDFETLITFYTKKELSLYKKGSMDDSELKRESMILDLAVKILTRTKKKRRDRTRESQTKMDTNLLTHSPFFAGGNRQKRRKAQEDGFVSLDKKGFRKMSYENSSGELLTTNDARTLLGLFSLWGRQGFGEWVSFTEFELLRELNIEPGGRQYEILRNSLNKLRDTSLVLHEAYDKKNSIRFVTERFQLIIADRFISDVTKCGKTKSRRFEIQFSPYIHKSIKEGYSTLVSLAILDELKSDVSQQFYLLLSGLKDMDKKEEYLVSNSYFRIPLNILYDSLFLQGDNYSRRNSVEKACEELKNIDVIDNYEFVMTGRAYSHVIINSSELLVEVRSKNNLKDIEDRKPEQIKFDDLDDNPIELNHPPLSS